MIRVTHAGMMMDGKQYLEFSGLSTDDKPTHGVLNGSLFHEVDTSAIYSLDEENGEWIKQMQLHEDDDTVSSSSLASSLASIPTIQMPNFGTMNKPDIIESDIIEPDVIEEPDVIDSQEGDEE